ncbi:hypothetical protein QE152_g9586 [Popillia japonica]|uniref:MADF domain-containing protein n=1 Tax=Popillia japonica TaxID=7064 RepID=A0AAW1LYH8_POPJA
MKTLCISNRVILSAFKDKDELGHFRGADKRGRKTPGNKTKEEVVAGNKTKEEVVAAVRAHIESFPTVESHCTPKCTQRKYLDSTLSITKMHSLYKEQCRERGDTEIDQCVTCAKYHQGSVDVKVSLKEEYEAHLRRKDQAQEAKKADKERAENDNSFMSVTFDLQSVLQIPSSEASWSYYMRKLIMYNLTPDVTVADIKAKFQGLKTNFLAEYRTLLPPLKTGAGEDDKARNLKVYHPTLWYYNDMFFILEHRIPRRSTDSLSFNEPPRSGSSQSESYTSNIDDIEYESQDDIVQNSEGDYEIQRDGTLRQRTDSLPPCTVTLTDNAEAIQARNQEEPIIAQATQPADIFAAFVASKLKQMNPQVANEVEEKITLLK